MADANSVQITLYGNGAPFSEVINQASKSLDQLAGKSKQIGHTTISSTQAASGALRELNGDFVNNIRAVERFITTIPGVGDMLKTAFPIVGGLAFGAMMLENGKKLYEFQQQLHNMPSAIRQGWDTLNESTRKAGVELDIANDKLGNAIAKLKHKPGDGLKLGLDEDRLAASNLAEEIEHASKSMDDLMKKNSTAGFMKQIGGFVFGEDQVSTKPAEDKIKGIMARLQKATDDANDAEDNATPGTDAQNVKARNRASLGNALTQARADLQMALDVAKAAQANPNEFAGHDAEILDYEGALRQVKSQQHNFSAGNERSDQETHKQGLEDAKQQAEDAKRAHAAALSAARAAATAQLRTMEEARLAEQQAGKLGAQADLDYWNARIGAFSKGSSEYLTVQRKVSEDKSSLVRSGEAFSAEQARGAEIAAKNAGALEQANVQLDLASHRITKLQADQRLGAVQAEEYTAKLKALREELAHLNADGTVSPEDKRNRGAAIQNQISDVQGQQSAAAVRNMVQGVEAANEHARAVRRDADALAALNDMESKNVTAMRELVMGHDLSTGAISRHDAALQAAALHAADYADQLGAIAQERASIATDSSLDDDQRKAKDDELKIRAAKVQGEADRSSLADQWDIQRQTAMGGVAAALQQVSAAAKDTAGMFEKLTLTGLNEVNRALVDSLTTRHPNHPWRQAGHALAVQGSSMAVTKAEGMGIDALANAPFIKDTPFAKLLTGLRPQKAPKGTSNDPLFVRDVGGGNGGGAGGVGVDVSKMLSGSTNQALSGIASKAASGFMGAIQFGATVPAFADGVRNFSGGVALVGERGPELAHLASGTNIVPNHALHSLMNAGIGGAMPWIGEDGPEQILLPVAA